LDVEVYLATATARHLCGGLYMATAFIALTATAQTPLVGLRTTWRMGNAHKCSRWHGNLDYLVLMPWQLNLISRSGLRSQLQICRIHLRVLESFLGCFC